jgi:hypothetical protein
MNGRDCGSIRIGVTGHQVLPNPEGLQNAVRLVFAKVESQFAGKRFEFYSPLAPGADTLTAQIAIQLNIPLIVLLPFNEREYVDSFAVEHLREFEQLAGKAQRVIRLPRHSELDMYQMIGNYLIQQMDYLVALWNGQEARGPGGTGEIVKKFIRTGKPCAWVYTRNGLKGSELQRMQGVIKYIN